MIASDHKEISERGKIIDGVHFRHLNQLSTEQLHFTLQLKNYGSAHVLPVLLVGF
jgi:hypothetical protein